MRRSFPLTYRIQSVRERNKYLSYVSLLLSTQDNTFHQKNEKTFTCSIKDTMKALYCQQNSAGEEIAFVFQERENLPVTRDNDVKIQVKACALSWTDIKLLSELKMKKEFLPVGREIAGVVLEVGSKVSFFQPDDEVVVHKPEKVPWVEAAGTIRDGLRAYTALHYLSHVSPGKTVLVMDGASPFGTIAIQLAQHRGAKVISTAYSLEDKQYLERLRPPVGTRQPLIARVIDVSNGKIDVAESCLEETGGLGVDIVLDAGVRLYSKEDESTLKPQLLPHKHDIITLLSVGGHWVTTEKNLQLDPPDSHCLFLKGATVSFLNDEVWNLSNVQQGKYLCILEDVMEKLSNSIFRPQLDEPVPLYEAKVSMEIVQKNQARKRQVIQF
ncbi:quinone oxidoreductase-like protein 1 isoform X2 [Chrysemys picta bellii]|uniref:quinone oxidoreductase-like protein 1 isoform X2 n=1 Tax=Chrysemys picta bellii TaxID=8478 RepID=UPI0032B213B6